ncbi:M23 family metallopeptidase [Mucilaginibacter auburnensis]|uniref:Murein DD-endopeptidase MepM/ murein hydrolase activator NlpD n=1 Tax=Mucilaginibacter auburnensis TaxID=1457233 RepID=A0A2H9VLW1_9SPHI|nr:M23 family metallopeptidase [Mucilaginibacter auburnensis]PJJ79311.1 murein DD-endopeptidase MepM/ murein hydrolase activator NlpD [Mucilaginibacter auburnensis]
MLNINNKSLIIFIPVLMLVASCSKMNGPAALFKTRSPHEMYADNLRSAGLERSELGRQWLTRASDIAASALAVKIPYKETGYFAPEKTQVVTFSFEAIKGQKLNISLTKKPAINFNIYLDVFERNKKGEVERVAYADTAGTGLEYEVEATGKYYLRLQPELLSGGQYTLTITAGPSLGFPVTASAKPRIGSFFGDGRDEGARSHEGIDIFAPKSSAAIAAANGVVTSVRENNLGGKVVFMRPDGKDYSLYYAHLDAQLVNPGQNVKVGDTIGLVGNTGNARYTPAHLHFGIYTNNGAVNPIHYVDKQVKAPLGISSPLNLLNATARVNKKVTVFNMPVSGASSIATLSANTPLTVTAAAANWYKVTLPNNLTGYIDAKALSTAKTLRTLAIRANTILYNQPDTLNAKPIAAIKMGERIDVLGNYNNYQLVSVGDLSGWILNN